MIATSRRLAERMLPNVRHLVIQRLANLLVALIDEAIGIEREFVPTGLVQPAGEAIRRKVTVRICFSLVRYKNVRELAVEQLTSEMIVSLLQAAVLHWRDRDWLIRRSFVRSTLRFFAR
jgi:hypothetical protein